VPTLRPARSKGGAPSERDLHRMRGDNWDHERHDLTSEQTRRVRLLAETDYRMSANPRTFRSRVGKERRCRVRPQGRG
jgi:hypothetical protein